MLIAFQKLHRTSEGGEQTAQVRVYSDASAQPTTSAFALSGSSQTELERVPVTLSIDTQTETTFLPEVQEAQPSEPSLPPPSYPHLLLEEYEKIGLEELSRWHSGIHSLDPLMVGT
jgi:hypothetical protein